MVDSAKESTAEPRPLRVLLWSPRGSGTQYYGPGSFHYRLYGAAAPGRFEVTLVHGLPQQQRFELFREQHFLGPLPGHDDSAWSRWRLTRRFLAAAKRFLNERHGAFDVFHGLTGFLPTMQPAAVAESLGLPAVIFIANHGIDLQDTARLQRILRLARQRQRIARRVSAVVAMSDAIARELRNCGVQPQRIARIPMAVDVQRFHPPTDDAERSAARRALGWADRPTLLFVGRVGRRKRPNLLIDAVAGALQAGHDSQAVIAGPADDQAFVDELDQQAASLGVTDRVIRAGFHEDPALLYRAADAFALPSANEGMPAALVEAMASGLPAIVTRISGCEDVVAEGVTGQFIEPQPTQAASAWRAYLDDAAMRRAHGAAARQRAERDHSTTRVLEQYEQLFRGLR